MRENLHAAEVAAESAAEDLYECTAVLESRQVRLQSLTTSLTDLPKESTKRRPLEVQQRRVGWLVAKASAEREAALDRQRQAQQHWLEAQANYDSTRDGMHDLRETLDADQHDTAAQQRYIIARQRYEQEAQRRVVAYGPQVPLSKHGMGNARGLAERMSRSGVRFWLKSVTGPEPEVRGRHGHRVNLTRTDSNGRRRSATLPYPTQHPVRPDGHNIRLDGEPVASEVCSYLSTQTIREGETFREWAVRMSKSGAPNSRSDWHAARQITSALSLFVR